MSTWTWMRALRKRGPRPLPPETAGRGTAPARVARAHDARVMVTGYRAACTCGWQALSIHASFEDAAAEARAHETAADVAARA